MRKRIILTLFMIVCLVLGGCGSSSDSRELVADEDYGDTADYEDDASSDTEDTASEDYEEESETSTVEDSMDDTDTSPAEAEGIVAMIRRLEKASSVDGRKYRKSESSKLDGLRISELERICCGKLAITFCSPVLGSIVIS